MAFVALTNEQLNTEFHRAVWDGHGSDYAKIANLLEAGADVNSYAPDNVPAANYQTALAQAILSNNFGLAVFLIDAGADVNQLTRQSGWFPLHCAITRWNLPMASMLLAHGADPHQRHQSHALVCQEETPLEFAVRLNTDFLGRHNDMVQVLSNA